ncbi:hypothetical protein [Metallibacterium scheffleri]
MKKNIAFTAFVGFLTAFFFVAIINLVAQKLNATFNEVLAMQAFAMMVIIGATIAFAKKYLIRPDPQS